MLYLVHLQNQQSYNQLKYKLLYCITKIIPDNI